MAHRMLSTATMSRTALALVLVAAWGSAASAGGFVGLGIGTSPATSGDTSFNEDGRSGRIEAGYRFGHFSIEGLGSRAGVTWGGADLPYTWTSIGLAAKYNLSLDKQFELFGRAGLQHTSFDQNQGSDESGGSGILVGAGAEFRPGLGADLAIVVDYTIEHSTLTSPDYPGSEWGLTSRVWTLGVTIGF